MCGTSAKVHEQNFRQRNQSSTNKKFASKWRRNEKEMSVEHWAGIWSYAFGMFIINGKMQWVARIYSDILFNFVHFISFDENIRKHSKRQARFDWKKTKNCCRRRLSKWITEHESRKWEIKSVQRARRSLLNDI